MLDRSRLQLHIVRESHLDAVVVKPAGMASELTRDPRHESLLSRLRLSAPEGTSPKLVHRLDRISRGLMVVAMNKDAAAFHGEQIREGLWDKYYLARIAEPSAKALRGLMGLHKAHLAEDDNRARIVRSGGKVSLMEVLGVVPSPQHEGQSHALIRLYTGRLHQIRVMMAGLGFALTGDDLYGGAAGEFYLEHAALRHVAADTKRQVMCFWPEDQDRERIAGELWRQLLKVTGEPG